MRRYLGYAVGVVCGVLLAASAAWAADELSVVNQRTSGMYSPGDKAVFVVTGAADGPLTVAVADYYRQTPVNRQQPVEPGKPVLVTIDTKDLPRLGWHQIMVKSAGQSATATFAVVPPAKEIVPITDSRFGVIVSASGKTEQLPDIMRGLRLAGARWVSTDIPLAWLNPKQGQFDWTASTPDGKDNFDAFVHAANKEGLMLSLKFLGQADWISKHNTKDDHAYWDARINLSPPADPAKWAEVVTATVKRYAPICQTWEIGNEPEGHGYFKGTDDDYMAYLETTSKSVRAAQPSATIVAASMYYGGGVLDRLVKRPECSTS